MSCENERNYILAERSNIGHVSLCACGTLHVSVGAVTLRMAPEAFGQMLRMCQDAADQLLLQASMANPASHLTH